jgi:hypothetical protein
MHLENPCFHVSCPSSHMMKWQSCIELIYQGFLYINKNDSDFNLSIKQIEVLFLEFFSSLCQLFVSCAFGDKVVNC